MSILNDLKEINCEAVFISVLPVYTKSQEISIEKRTGLLTFSKEESHLFSLLHIQRFNLKADL